MAGARSKTKPVRGDGYTLPYIPSRRVREDHHSPVRNRRDDEDFAAVNARMRGQRGGPPEARPCAQNFNSTEGRLAGTRSMGDLAAALRKRKGGAAAFSALAPSHRRRQIEWVEETKRAETRGQRIARIVELVLVRSRPSRPRRGKESPPGKT